MNSWTKELKSSSIQKKRSNWSQSLLSIKSIGFEIKEKKKDCRI